MTLVLEARGVEKRFGGTLALNNVDFSLEEAEIHALLGENGAGKSTLAKIFAGVMEPDKGEVCLHGRAVRLISPGRAQALGIGTVFQELDLFPHLSVAENLSVMNSAAGEGYWVRPYALHRWCSQFLDQVGLDIDPGTRLDALSTGERQLVAIARALSMRARVILMDEPTSSLSQANVDVLFATLEKLRQQGIAIVYISHKMEEVTRLCDRVTVLRDGTRIATGNAKQMTVDELVTLMVGRSLRKQQRTVRTPGPVLLDVRSLDTDYLSGISFRLHAGEVLGIAGLVGAGRSEVGAALFGLRSHARLDVTLGGCSFSPTTPYEALKAGFSLLPEERGTDSILPHMTALENITIGALRTLQCQHILHRSREAAIVEPLLERVKLRADTLGRPIAVLSGGNQQKAILARCILMNPSVMFLDEPTRGIDVSAKEQIYELIHDLILQGRGFIFVSSDCGELLHCCDRILVLRGGRTVALLDVDRTSQQEVLALALGMPASREDNPSTEA